LLDRKHRDFVLRGFLLAFTEENQVSPIPVGDPGQEGGPKGTALGQAHGNASALGVFGHKLAYAPPCVRRGVDELRLLAVEEAVGGAWIHNEVVALAGALAGGVELVDSALRDALIRAPEEGQDRAGEARDRVDRLRTIGPAAQPEWPAVEADDPAVAEAARRLEVGERSAEAEADREERPRRATLV